MDFNIIDPEDFFERTVDADMQSQLSVLMNYVSKGGKILDAGCGSGRDSKSLQEAGYDVTAFDAHPDVCRLARERLGIQALQMRFEDVEWESEFDGIWACASLLHLTPTELPDAVQRLTRALKPHGVLVMSFKEGDGEWRDSAGRYFNGQTRFTLVDLIKATDGLKFAGFYRYPDAIGRPDVAWVTAIGRRVPKSRSRVRNVAGAVFADVTEQGVKSEILNEQ